MRYAKFCHIVAKVIISNIVISGVRPTGPNPTKFLHNAKILLPFNFLKSKVRYCNPFQNASTTTEGMSPISPIFLLKLVAMAKSLGESQSDIPGYQASTSLKQS